MHAWIHCPTGIIRKAADTVDGKPRGTAELTRFIKAHISRGHTVVSDGSAVEPRKGSANVVSSWKRSGRHHGRLVPRLWVNKLGWHSNNIESCFNKLKRWARKRCSCLPIE